MLIGQEDSRSDEEAGAVAGKPACTANSDPTDGSCAYKSECQVADVSEVISGEDSFQPLGGDGGVAGCACDEVAALELLSDVDISRAGDIPEPLPGP